MAEQIDPVNMNHAMLSSNTFSVKEEQCQEDSFVEDKVCISETAITTDNAELQGLVWHAKIKQYEEFTSLDNIKTEFINDTKTEFNNKLLYCENCEAYYGDYCIECGMLVHILNKYALNNAGSGARKDIPNDILELQDCFGRTGIYALRIIPAGVKFGPFTGLNVTEYSWERKGEKFILENKSKYLNWMQYVNPTRNTCDGNLHVFQSEDNVYYQSTCQIQAGDELLVYIGEEYGISPNEIIVVDFVTTVKDVSKDIFACTFCCLGFSSKSHLAKHKTICVGDTAGQFSIEELTQCSFCKIHLDQKEYFEHHMTFCCERNARKCILPTLPAKRATAASNGRKRCLRQLYKCERCKYRAKHQADLKEHINNQHYEVKMYKCGICNRRFKTQESLRLHVENTHAYVRGKDNQKHSTADYRNAHIKAEELCSQHQKKIFKCPLCVFRAKYKQSLSRHIKTKHLMQFDYKCDSCEFGTNNKTDLERHIKTKHLKVFDYKCDKCEFGTNMKTELERHIKTKHLQKFDFKCESCEYGTNSKQNIDRHIKTKHLKEFDFKCDSCEYGTNSKRNLERHIKAKHFDYKCDSCEYRTSIKHCLERHIRTKHLKQFDYKCDSCEFGTNSKKHLEDHIKAKHLKEFDYKCDKCKFGTNMKTELKRHIKTKHLKTFDFKCDSCEYKTNIKQNLKVHIRTKHLKQFNFKCHFCGYGTSSKQNLERHIKIKHLMEFDHKCDSCEFRTNNKSHLEGHIKTKHLRKFDYKCDSCEFRTNNKSHLEGHIKTKHLKVFDYNCDSCEYRTNHKNSLENHVKRKHL